MTIPADNTFSCLAAMRASGDNPTLTNVTTSNIQFVSSGVDTVEFYCNNTDSADDSTLDCVASFTLTKEYSQSGTLSSSFTATISETVTMGEDLLVRMYH